MKWNALFTDSAEVISIFRVSNVILSFLFSNKSLFLASIAASSERLPMTMCACEKVEAMTWAVAKPRPLFAP